MGVENASSIAELNPDAPLGTESISEGDNHIRVIKNALKKSFPNITGEIDWSPQDFIDVKNALNNVPDGNGIFASCKFNGIEVKYGHNVSSVTIVNNGQYRVNFTKPTDGFDNHYAVQVTPIATNNKAVIVCVNDQRDAYCEFSAKEEVTPGVWGTPTGPIGFYMTMIDMIQTEQNSET